MSIDPQVEAVRAEVDVVLADPLYWFPVRHHSPAAAAFVAEAILERRPKVVFIEGPSHANAMIPHIIDRDTRPPIALYSAFRDEDDSGEVFRTASYYPLVEYSPEYQAMKAATKVDADLCFIDRPQFACLTEEEVAPINPDALISGSSFYQSLAEVAGYESWSEAWDSLFEYGEFRNDRERFRRELATFCAAARRSSQDDAVTTLREAHMLHCIQDYLAEHALAPDQAMVICGGFHLFLDRQVERPPAIPEGGSVTIGVIPYSFFRISEQSGYGAGNAAPQFYQSCWQHRRAGNEAQLCASHTVEILRRARRLKAPVSSADAISACQHSTMLAALRGRPMPILRDIHDAIITTCCKGNPEDDGQLLYQAMAQAGIGRAIGKVTPKVGRVPLVSDFYAQLSDLDLGEAVEDEQTMRLKLDLREPFDRQRSAFLNRLVRLKVPLAKCLEDKNRDWITGLVFQEVWSLRWSPEVEPALVEKNLLGDTIESAALASVRLAAAEARDAQAVTCELRRAVTMNLRQAVAHLRQATEDALATDDELLSLTGALLNLRLTDKLVTFREMQQARVAPLAHQAFDRACFAIAGSANVSDDDVGGVIDAIKTLAEEVFRDRDDALERDHLVQCVQHAAQASQVIRLQGAFHGLLVELNTLSPDDLAAEVGRFIGAPPEILVEAGDYLWGMLAVARSAIMLGSEALVGAIDRLFASADWPAFTTMLPRLRDAFGKLQHGQRQALAAQVADLLGLSTGRELTTLNTSVGAAVLFAEVDAEVAAIMHAWSFDDA